jgi:hypothetical protein
MITLLLRILFIYWYVLKKNTIVNPKSFVLIQVFSGNVLFVALPLPCYNTTGITLRLYACDRFKANYEAAPGFSPWKPDVLYSSLHMGKGGRVLKVAPYNSGEKYGYSIG